MSWMSENYHLAALGVGVLTLGGLGYLGYSALNETEEQLALSGSSKGKTVTVPRLTELKNTAVSVAEIDEVAQPTFEDRNINMFTSVDLFVREGSLQEAIDLLEQPPIHPGYDNQLWVDSGVDPGFSDAPDRDHDGDGYSNGEEFDFGTDPADPKDFPALVHKVKVGKIETTKWYLMLNSTLGNGRFQLKYQQQDPAGKLSEIRMRGDENVKVGGVFFKKEPAQNRFKLVNIGEREVKRGGAATKQKTATVEDLKPNRMGEQFKVLFRPKGDELKNSFRFDDIVHFRVDAAGLSGESHPTELNRSFEVETNGKKSSFKLLEVKRNPDQEPTSVVIEYLDSKGEQKTREIQIK